MPAPTLNVDEIPSINDILTTRIPIPPDIHSMILPQNNLCSSDLIRFCLPPANCNDTPLLLNQPGGVFSKSPSLLDAENALILVGRPIPTYDELQAVIQVDKLVPALDAGHVSICYPIESVTVASLKLPMWVLTYWQEVHNILRVKTQWGAAISWLEKHDTGKDDVFSVAVEMIKTWPWNVPLPKSMGVNPATLPSYCGSQWLAAEHMDQMGEVLAHSISDASIAILPNSFSVKLLEIFRNHLTSNTAYHLSRGIQHLLSTGEAVRAGNVEKLAFSVGVQVLGTGCVLPNTWSEANHWAAVVISIDPRVLYYGDSLALSPPAELTDMVEWWLQQHDIMVAGDLERQDMACTKQVDGFSCSILSMNAMAHLLRPDVYPLLSPTECDRARAQHLVDIMRYLSRDVDTFEGTFLPLNYSIRMMNYRYNPQSSAVPVTQPVMRTSVKRPVMSLSRSKPKSQKRARTRAQVPSRLGITDDPDVVEVTQGSSRGTKEEWAAVLAPQVSNKSAKSTGCLVAYQTEKRGQQKSRQSRHQQGTATDEENGGNLTNSESSSSDEEGQEAATVQDLVDMAPKKRQPNARKIGGRPPDPLLEQLTVQCFKPTNPQKILWRCVGNSEDPCLRHWSKRSLARVVRHAKYCPRLSNELRMRAQSYALSRSLSHQLDPATASQSSSSSPATMLPLSTPQASSFPSTPTTPNLAQESPKITLATHARSTGRKERHLNFDLAIVKLICVAGLPPSIVSRPEWNDLLLIADRSYKPATRDRLEYEDISNQAVWVRQQQLTHLRTQFDLTISFDGGTSTGRESYWTVHISDPQRRVYLMETREATSESHTAEWIVSYVRRVAADVGFSRFSGVCCDSTGNTLAARRLLCTKTLPVAFNLADCCHHLNRTILDLTKIPEFESAIKIIRKTVTTFHSSHFGFAALKAARERHHTGRGLEAIGKTRFATIVLSAMSVQRSLIAIKDVIQSAPDGMFEASDIEDYYQSTPSQATFDFESHLAQLIHATYPATKALACLEALEATAADVYVFWHAVIRATEDALVNKKNRFLPDTVDAVQQVLYTRHNQLFGSGNLANNVYLAAAYLNANYLKSDLWKVEGQDQNLLGIRHPSIFLQVGLFLGGIALQEVLHGSKPEFKKWEDRKKSFKEQLRSELLAYARHQYPFNLPVDESIPQGVLKWWRGLISESAQILPHLAIKIYTVRVNSMPEEVTGSVFTWLTPKLHNRMSVDTMSAMTQIRQYYQTEQKTRARSNPRPTVKFYEIKKKVFPSSDDGPSAMSDDEDEGTTDVAKASDVLDGSINNGVCVGACIGKEDLPYINMDTRIITDIIADDTPSPRKGEGSGGQGEGDDWPIHSSWDIASDDDDFTMDDLFRA